MTAVAQDAETTSTARNTPARISIGAASLGAALIAGVFLTPLFWLLYGGLYTFLVFATGVVAIPAGHPAAAGAGGWAAVTAASHCSDW